MAKRYLSLDEAVQKLGIGKEELNRLREKGEIRGFADRGTFKFKEDDVDELGRRLQPSSDPDVPMIDADDDGSVLDDEPSAEGSGLSGAPSIIRRLSGGEPSSSAASDEAGSIFDDFGSGGASDSDVRLVMDDRLDEGHDSGPDVLLQLQESDSDVRLSNENDSDSNVKIDLSDSDSDVRLSSTAKAGGSAIKLGMGDSDSDVRLSDDSASRLAMPDSDSDVQLASAVADSGPLSPKPDSDSDVMLVSEEPDSDSDVHLASDEDSELELGLQSDSDVRMVSADSDSDVRLLDDARLAGPKSKVKKGSDSDVAVLPDSGLDLETPKTGKKSGVYSEGSSVLLDDSDIALDQGSGISLTSQSGINLVGPQSGIALDRVADSGVSLEKKSADDDSGLALFDEDSEGGITLESDSGIALQMDDEDSGISITSDEDEGGITLADMPGADSGISLKDDEDLQLTETIPAMKIPKEKKKPGADSISDTMLEVPSVSDDVDQAESDFEIGAADGSSQGDTSVLLFDDEDETDDGGAAMVKKKAADEEEDESFEFSEAEEEEAEVAEGEEDVFAGDEAFEEESEFESEGEFEPTAKVAVAGAIEYPWGAGVVSTLAVSSIVMIFCGMASIELVRSMWGYQGYTPANGWLIEILGGLFK